MLFKSLTASFLLLALTSVNADQGGCVVSPPLGITGTPGSSDVLQPSSNAPCGKAPISQYIDASTTVQADTTGKFKVSMINFER